MTIKPATVLGSSLVGAPVVLGTSVAAIPENVTDSIFTVLFFAFLAYLAKESRSQRAEAALERASREQERKDRDEEREQERKARDEEQRLLRASIDQLGLVFGHVMSSMDDTLATFVEVRETDDTADRERAVSGYFRRATVSRTRLLERLSEPSTNTREIPHVPEDAGRRPSPAP